MQVVDYYIEASQADNHAVSALPWILLCIFCLYLLKWRPSHECTHKCTPWDFCRVSHGQLVLSRMSVVRQHTIIKSRIFPRVVCRETIPAHAQVTEFFCRHKNTLDNVCATRDLAPLNQECEYLIFRLYVSVASS